MKINRTTAIIILVLALVILAVVIFRDQIFGVSEQQRLAEENELAGETEDTVTDPSGATSNPNPSARITNLTAILNTYQETTNIIGTMKVPVQKDVTFEVGDTIINQNNGTVDFVVTIVDGEYKPSQSDNWYDYFGIPKTSGYGYRLVGGAIIPETGSTITINYELSDGTSGVKTMGRFTGWKFPPA